MRVPKVLSKIGSDFKGAVGHWCTRMQRWEFVHNDERGLPAQATRRLEDLREAYPDISLTVCGYAELRQIAMALDLEQLQDLFGFVPSRGDLRRLDFQALQPVLEAIQRGEPDPQGSITAPSPAKLERNSLSQDAAGLLRLGRQRESLVEKFFDNLPDPAVGGGNRSGVSKAVRRTQGQRPVGRQDFRETTGVCRWYDRRRITASSSRRRALLLLRALRHFRGTRFRLTRNDSAHKAYST